MKKFIFYLSRDWALLALIVVIIFHGYLVTKTFWFDAEGNIRAAIAGYGDIPFHLTQVSKFAFGSFDLNEPIFTGERLRYAFFINLISGLILRITGSWTFSLHFPTIFFIAAGTILVYLIYQKLLVRRWAAILAVTLFFLGSGFGSYYQYQKYFVERVAPDKSFAEYLTDNNISTISKWDASYPQQNINWGAPLSLVFLHQRSFFLGFFLFVLFVYLLTRLTKDLRHNDWVWPAMVLGISPLAHYHSFVSMGMVAATFLAIQFFKKRTKLVKKILQMFLLGIIIASPQIIYLADTKDGLQLTGSRSFIDFHWGWMTEPTIGSVKFQENGLLFSDLLAFFNYLWINFGVILPLFVLAIFFVKRPDFRHHFPLGFFALAGLVLMLSVQFIRFQPWDYDNNKMLVYFQFFATPLIISIFLWLIPKWGRAAGFLLVIFSIVAIHSGIIDNLPRFIVKKERMPTIFTTDAINLAEFIKNRVKPSEQILTSSTHLNPVNSLAGRPVLVGYPGWLWTKGFPYSERENRIREYYQNPSLNSALIHEFNIKYVLIDLQAKNDWDADTQWLENNLSKIFSAGQYTLYRIP